MYTNGLKKEVILIVSEKSQEIMNVFFFQDYGQSFLGKVPKFQATFV